MQQKEDISNALRGFAMGAADIVPGVSGGTVALILGIYGRLVRAIGNIDAMFVQFVVAREWKQGWAYIDGRFLVSLGFGIGSGIIGLASLMSYLLQEQRERTFALFFGLILASSWIVIRQIRVTTGGERVKIAALIVTGVLIAVAIVTRPLLAGSEHLLYVFCSGAVAICAMILPGVSGAYILLLLGKYEDITSILKSLPKLEFSGADLLQVGVFSCGCLFGLITFCKILRWLLARYQQSTMALLSGFMIGSLVKVWPFQRDLTPEVHSIKRKVFESYFPESIGSLEMQCITIAALALAAVVILEKVAQPQSMETD